MVSASVETFSETENCLISERYPETIVRWCDLISHHATIRNIDPDLVAAVMLQESGGDPQAYSHSGAVGLMQIMPRDGIAKTFMCKNGPCFSSRPTIDELQDPEYNIIYGTRMLIGLYDKTGSWREALKAYGPMDRGYEYADKVLSLFEHYKE